MYADSLQKPAKPHRYSCAAVPLPEKEQLREWTRAYNLPHNGSLTATRLILPSKLGQNSAEQGVVSTEVRVSYMLEILKRNHSRKRMIIELQCGESHFRRPR